MKILVLGYSPKKTKIFKFLKKYNSDFKISYLKKKTNSSFLKKFDLVISFGYRYILKKKDLKNLNRPIINLHMSYLPYNKGSHPNFWSFIENTPSGISIHEIDHGVDTGKIIFQKKINFNYKKNPKLNFRQTYNFLFKELEFFFLKKIKSIISGKYKCYKQKHKGTMHYKNDLPKRIIKNWNQSIAKTVLKYNNYIKVAK